MGSTVGPLRNSTGQIASSFLPLIVAYEPLAHTLFLLALLLQIFQNAGRAQKPGFLLGLAFSFRAFVAFQPKCGLYIFLRSALFAVLAQTYIVHL